MVPTVEGVPAAHLDAGETTDKGDVERAARAIAEPGRPAGTPAPELGAAAVGTEH